MNFFVYITILVKKNAEIYNKVTDEEIERMVLNEKLNYEDTDNYYDKDYLEDDYSEFDISVLDDMIGHFKDLEREDYDFYLDFVSLLALEYYNIVIQDKDDYDEYYVDEDNDLLMAIKDMSKDEFIKCVEYDENDFLIEIIDTILDEYDPEPEEVCEYDYVYIERFFNEEEFQKVYNKFHPNLELELEEIKKYMCNSELMDYVSKISFTKLFDYIYLSLLTKVNVDKKIYYHDILTYKLQKIFNENEELYNEIILYLTQFLYVYIKNKKEKSDFEIEVINTIEEEPKDGIEYITDEDYLIDSFYDYDILTHHRMIQNLSEDTKKKTKKFIR